MPFPQRWSEITWSNSWKGTSQDRPHQSPRNHGLAYPHQSPWSTIIPRLWQLLQRLHCQLFTHYTTPTWSYKEKYSMALGRTTMHRVWNTQGAIHIVPSPPKPRSYKMLHIGHRHIQICSRSHHQPTVSWWTPSNRILLEIFATSRVQLRHLQSRTPCYHLCHKSI